MGRLFFYKRSELTKAFRLVACNDDGQPLEDLGELPQSIRDNREGTAALYRKVGFVPPWIGYLAVCDGSVGGGGAFVGPPQQNSVEIAYFTLRNMKARGSRRAPRMRWFDWQQRPVRRSS